MRTKQREFLEDELIPKFSKLFDEEDFVVNIGAGQHPYKERFNCKYLTADIKDRSAMESWAVEDIPYKEETFDGILFNGVFERVDDPMLAMSEIWRVLKKGGYVLFGAPGLRFEWSVDRDRWRLSPGGAKFVVKDFEVLESHNIGNGVYHFFILKK